MKSKFLFAAAMLLGLFTACSDDSDNGITPEEGSVELVINIRNSSIVTRAFDDAGTFPGSTGGKERTTRIELKDFYVYTFNSSGGLLSATKVDPVNETNTDGSSSTTTVVAKVKTEDTVKSVYILGNYSDTYPTVGTLAELQTELHQQSAILPATLTDDDKLIVVGYAPVSTSGTPYTASITLAPLSTKINVHVIDGRGTGDFLAFEDISILYSASQSHLFAQVADASRPVDPADDAKKGLEYAVALPADYSTETTKYYASGLDDWESLDADYTSTGILSLVKDWAEDGIEDNKPYMQTTFYTYAPMRNASQEYDKPMIVTLRGIKDGQERFFSVNMPKEVANLSTVNPFISNGYCYNVKITVNGDASSTTDPEKEAKDLQVTVTQAEWTIVTIGKDFD